MLFGNAMITTRYDAAKDILTITYVGVVTVSDFKEMLKTVFNQPLQSDCLNVLFDVADSQYGFSAVDLPALALGFDEVRKRYQKVRCAVVQKDEHELYTDLLYHLEGPPKSTIHTFNSRDRAEHYLEGRLEL